MFMEEIIFVVEKTYTGIDDITLEYAFYVSGLKSSKNIVCCLVQKILSSYIIEILLMYC